MGEAVNVNVGADTDAASFEFANNLWNGMSPLFGAGRTLSEVTADLEGACCVDPPSIGALESSP